MNDETQGNADLSGDTRVFLCGDVMTGRGIDQILPHPGDPALYEPSIQSAVTYVELAERAHGAIARPVDFGYVWGEALTALEARTPDARVVNLETAVTTSRSAAPKGINYRMHPANVSCLTAAGLGCCCLANNHVLDWGVAGLLETLDTLHSAGIATAGAGRNESDARAPAVLDAARAGRVLVFAAGSPTSGVSRRWEAGREPGIALAADLSAARAEQWAEHIATFRQPRDIVVASIHWGENWGYAIPADQRAFAHALVDSGVVDIVHGHSSHHVKGIEVYEGKLILYGCGDFITDYEGIGGYEAYRSELAVAYFATVAPETGRLRRLEMDVFRARRLRLEYAPRADVEWLRDSLSRDGEQLGTSVSVSKNGSLELNWRA